MSRAGFLPVLALAVGLLVPAMTHSQTLQECIALARKNAPAIRISEAEVARAEEAIREARAALAPTLRIAGSGVQRSEAQKTVIPIPVPGTAGPLTIKTGSATTIDVRAEGRLPLDPSGRDRSLVRAAEAAHHAELRGREGADADLVLRVSQSFYRAIAAQRLETAALDAVDAAAARSRLSASQVRAGTAQRLDSLQARVDLMQRESALLRSHEAVRVARVELETAIGATLDPSGALISPGAPSPPALEAAAAESIAVHARPELFALDDSLRENEQRIRAARAERGLSLGLSGTAQYLGPNRNEDFLNLQDAGLKTYNLYAGIDLSFPILDGGLASAREGELRAERSVIEARRRRTELEVRRDVERSLSDLRVALADWQSDSSRVTVAAEALRIAGAGYRGGTTTASQVRDVESALADARAQEAQSLMDTWSAEAALAHAMGSASAPGGN
jgi:outer membrane protein TolC